LAIAVFLLIPFTQHIGDQSAQTIDFREIITMQAPAPSAPPTSAEDAPKPIDTPKPLFEKQLPEPTLTQLDLALNPGIGEALAIGVAGGGFQTETDTVGDIQKMFTFSDLAQSPRIVNRPTLRYPNALVRRGVLDGKVVVLIEIDERGRPEILKIVSATDPLLVKPARDVIRQARFTPPTVDGRPQKVRGEWPIILQAPK
jgi:protein TonB